MNVWYFILNKLKGNESVALLYVIDSKGSSPGRKGFMMAVDKNGLFEGTIGGGIMEVKLIELASSKMAKADFQNLIKIQHHNKQHKRNLSGLICSGQQTVAILNISPDFIASIKIIIDATEPLFLQIASNSKLKVTSKAEENLHVDSETKFDITVKIKPPITCHIIGCGHVGLALAKQMALLGYRVIQYDNRPNLARTFLSSDASQIRIVDYKEIKSYIVATPNDVVVMVSFSYRTDKVLLKQLYDLPVAYIGMMGSDQKIATLKKELEEEGFSDKDLDHVFMPIGMNIYSKTAQEIAVSIAGQIILQMNKMLPTGRDY